MEPVYTRRAAQFVPRLMLPLSLSYDHRVDRRRRRHPLPALGRRGARAAVPAGAAGMTWRATKTRSSTKQTLRFAFLRVFVSSWRILYDSVQLVVVGGGPGGYAAAFLAADLGLSVALVDPEANPGGVCVYRGCIPSKALLHVAKLIDESRHAKAWGVEFGEPKVDLAEAARVQEQRREAADQRHRSARQGTARSTTCRAWPKSSTRTRCA